MLFLIPLRRYFVRDMHGQFPYPEATAITEVLVTGEKGGSQAQAAAAGDGDRGRLRLLRHDVPGLEGVRGLSLRPGGPGPGRQGEDGVPFDAIGFILGLGYVMGLRSSLMLCAGGVLSNFVLVPLVWFIGSHLGDAAVYPATVPIAKMTATQIFRGYVRFMGVGAIATAGIFGIIKSLRMVAGSFGIAMRAFRAGRRSQLERTDRDIAVMPIFWRSSSARSPWRCSSEASTARSRSRRSASC